MATETAGAPLVSSVEVRDSGPAAKEITIEIPAEQVNDRLNAQFGDITTHVALPGFRRGKVPRRLVERRFGQDVRNETKQKLINDAVTEVVQERQLKILGNPGVEKFEELVLEPGQPFRFTVQLEVLPEFELPPLENIEVKRPVMEVTSEMVDREIKAFEERRGRFEPVEGEPQPGDFLLGQAHLIDAQGAEAAHLEQAATRIPLPEAEGKGVIAGVQVENLGEALTGKKAGDLIEVATTGPENHEIESLRGQPMTVRFQVDQVVRLIPATMEELQRILNVEDEAGVRERAEQALRTMIENEQRDVMRRQVTRYLLDHTPMELPQRASAAQASRILQQAYVRMLQQGVPQFEIQERMAGLRASSQQRAQTELKIMFIMERLAEQLDVQISETELNQRIVTIARQQGVRPEQLRHELIRTNQAGILAAQVRHEKTVDRLLESAKITDVSAEEWNREQEAQGLADAAAEGSA